MRQLSGLDASFLSMESKHNVGHVTGVTILDTSTAPGEWTFELFKQHILSRLNDIPIFRERLVEVPFGLDRPYWVPDEDFELDYHLRHIGLPGEGTREQFAEQVARIHERPLDRRRPLWEMYLVDRAQGDLRAIIGKVHHAAIDGMSGQEVLATLVDLDPNVPVPTDAKLSPLRTDIDQTAINARATMNLLSSPLRVTKAAVKLVQNVPVLGELVGKATARGDESNRQLARRFGAAPKTPFNATIGPHRRWSFTSISLSEVKKVKNHAGCTVNDVVMAVVADALREWLKTNGGVPTRPLAAMIPLSVRSESQKNEIGNFVSSTIATLATHIEDPVERLQEIHNGMQRAKAQHGALPADMLTDMTQVAPPAVTALAARLVAGTKLANRVSPPFNLVISNVPGPPIPLYIAGAKMVAQYPVSAIVDGVGLNVTVQSTNHNLDFGFVACRDLIPDLWAMSDLMQPAFDRLAEAVFATESAADRDAAEEKAKKAADKKASKKKASAKKKAAAKKKPAKAKK